MRKKLATFLLVFCLTVLFSEPQASVSAQWIKSENPKSISSPSLKNDEPTEAPSVIGGDGDFTVTALNTVVNNYAVLATDAPAGSAAFTVTNIANLNSAIPQLGNLAVGDLLMIIQMQGATINTTDTVAYGNVTALNSAGLYEFVTVGAIVGNTVTINGEGCILGLRNSYTTAGRTQVVRVPQFRNLTVNAGASIVPTAWNGASGGIVVIQPSRNLVVNGTISANAAGFRGGVLDNDTIATATDTTTYRSTASADGAEKGEGIAGYQADYDAVGRYGRGAPANGGGGGNGHNGGGGGGANGNNGNAWSGQGVMPATPLVAWQLDPGYIANGNALTNSSGGGRGGYTFSNSNQDALTVAPGNAAWGGNSRRERGGLGGRPLTNNPASRLFLGGGGGAGDANNTSGGAGGRGGGLVLLQAGTVTGTGTITADGANGNNTVPTHIDAPGGGGAGGTVVISSFLLSGVSISANGGAGGNQLLTVTEAEGPGGGGGGGYIAVRTGAPTRTANAGLGGTTTSSALTEFIRNGSTNGAAGQNNAAVTTLPICVTPSSAPVEITGRVLAASGRAISAARIDYSDSRGNAKTALSNSFGYFRFTGVPSGETVVLTVSHRRYQFSNASLVVVPVDSVTEVSFTADR